MVDAKTLQQWQSELGAHLSADLGALELGDGKAIGYTYKCMGAGFACLRLVSRPAGAGDAKSGPTVHDLNAELPVSVKRARFCEGLRRLIACAGDADTNGAVAGAMMGCFLGYEALPPHLLAGMPHRDWLHEKAEKLWARICSQNV